MLNKMLAQNTEPFSPHKSYNKFATSIYLDTLLYGPDETKMIIFIIHKTDPTKIEHYGEDTIRFHYGTNYFYCLKDTIAGHYKIFDYGTVNFVNFHSYNAAKNVLYEYCFKRRAVEKNADGIKYNMNDLRFWNGPILKTLTTDSSFIRMIYT